MPLFDSPKRHKRVSEVEAARPSSTFKIEGMWAAYSGQPIRILRSCRMEEVGCICLASLA